MYAHSVDGNHIVTSRCRQIYVWKASLHCRLYQWVFLLLLLLALPSKALNILHFNDFIRAFSYSCLSTSNFFISHHSIHSTGIYCNAAHTNRAFTSAFCNNILSSFKWHTFSLQNQSKFRKKNNGHLI